MMRADGDSGGQGRLARRADGSMMALLVAAEDAGGRFALLETVEVRGSEPPRHLHRWEDETVYVLEGELSVCVAGERMAAPAGTAVFLPRGVEHSFAVTTDTARILTILSPAGLEGLYGELHGSENETGLGIERLVTVAARHGVEITGPGPRADCECGR